MSLSRGAFKFTPGAWHRMGLRVVLNDVGKANGVVEVTLNGERKIYYDKVNYRTKPGRQGRFKSVRGLASAGALFRATYEALHP